MTVLSLELSSRVAAEAEAEYACETRGKDLYAAHQSSARRTKYLDLMHTCSATATRNWGGRVLVITGQDCRLPLRLSLALRLSRTGLRRAGWEKTSRRRRRKFVNDGCRDTAGGVREEEVSVELYHIERLASGTRDNERRRQTHLRNIYNSDPPIPILHKVDLEHGHVLELVLEDLAFVEEGADLGFSIDRQFLYANNKSARKVAGSSI